MEQSAVEAILELARTGRQGFIVSQSCGPDREFKVIADFKSIEAMQAFYSALVQCGQVAQQIEAERQAYQ